MPTIFLSNSDFYFLLHFVFIGLLKQVRPYFFSFAIDKVNMNKHFYFTVNAMIRKELELTPVTASYLIGPFFTPTLI